jgi:hypothetical protein
MFGFSYPAATTPSISAMEQRLRKLEGQIDRAGRSGGRQVSGNLSSGNLSEAGDQVGSAIASAVSEAVNRFRSGGRWARDDAMRFGNNAARLGNDALNRLATEVEHRPLMTLAVAVGVGALIGITRRRG